MTLNAKLRAYTEQLNQRGLLRTRQVAMSLDSQMVHFDSNDYLSLSTDPRIAEAYQSGYRNYPSSSGGSMLLNGYHANHQAVERAFATLLAVDDCILFSSGYAANLALTALLGQIKAHCFIDKGVHASVYDGLALAQVDYQRYRHNDLADLISKLTSCSGDSLVLTEGVFSMTGQRAPLAAIAKHSLVLVDEAHSFGVLGDEGRGAVDSHGLSQNEVPLRMIPFGKAFAAQGALIAGKQEWIHALLQAGRSVIYSTAPSPALAYGLLKTLDVVVQAEERRLKLQELIHYFRSCVKTSSHIWIDSNTQIQQLQLGCPHRALRYAQELKKAGISCSAIRSPTVSTKLSGLRVILNYRHHHEDIQLLFNTLKLLYETTSD